MGQSRSAARVYKTRSIPALFPPFFHEGFLNFRNLPSSAVHKINVPSRILHRCEKVPFDRTIGGVDSSDLKLRRLTPMLRGRRQMQAPGIPQRWSTDGVCPGWLSRSWIRAAKTRRSTDWPAVASGHLPTGAGPPALAEGEKSSEKGRWPSRTVIASWMRGIATGHRACWPG